MPSERPVHPMSSARIRTMLGLPERAGFSGAAGASPGSRGCCGRTEAAPGPGPGRAPASPPPRPGGGGAASASSRVMMPSPSLSTIPNRRGGPPNSSLVTLPSLFRSKRSRIRLPPPANGPPPPRGGPAELPGPRFGPLRPPAGGLAAISGPFATISTPPPRTQRTRFSIRTTSPGPLTHRGDLPSFVPRPEPARSPSRNRPPLT